MKKSTSSEITTLMNNTISSMDRSKSSSIDILNDYCLDKVFSYLCIDDRACCERVCQHWKKVIQDSWLNMTPILDSSKSMWDLIVQEYERRNDNTLMKTRSLSRFGHYLDKLNLGDYKKSQRSSLLKNICKYCPNITYLNILNYRMSPQILLKLSEHCKKIIVLAIDGGLLECEEGLSKLFSNNKELCYTCIRNFRDVTGECFLHLPSINSISIMKLHFCHNIQTRWLNSSLEQFVNLSSLTLHQCSGVDELTFQIVSRMTKIKTFIFHPVYTQSLPIRALHSLVNLVNLEHLELSHETLITDDLLHDISNRCKKLIMLDLQCKSITNRGSVRLLKNLQNLEHLSLIDTRITQAILEAADVIAAYRRRKLFVSYSVMNSMNSIFVPKLGFLNLRCCSIPNHHIGENNIIFIS